MKILVIGLGYVGTANAVLLASKNEVICFDLDEDKVKKINDRISPIEDKQVSKYLSNKDLNIVATSQFPKDQIFDFVIIATPTNYDPESNYFDISSVESSIKNLESIGSKATIVIRSTLPVGFTAKLQKDYKFNEIIFVPEFLREGQALKDNLYPSRIIVGSKCKSSADFANLLLEAAKKNDIDILFIESSEAEAVKLFANTYLAMRVSFFNELDSYALANELDTRSIIDGVCLDERIGDNYNNPSFGYGGYCLPKDTKQLLASFDNVPQEVIKAVVKSNTTRMNFLSAEIIKKDPKIVGIYRLVMKHDSDNFRYSAIQNLMKEIRINKIEIIIFVYNIIINMNNIQ